MDSFHSRNGIAYPKDMEHLRQVFDKFCREHGLTKGSADADDVGRAVMSLYAAGVIEEDALLDSLAEFLRCRT